MKRTEIMTNNLQIYSKSLSPLSYLGHAILCELLLQMSKQLQGHLTYFRPGGAFRMGVASLH